MVSTPIASNISHSACVCKKTFKQGLDRAEKALYNVFAKCLNAESTESIARERIAEIFGQKDQVEASVAVDTAKEDALSKSLREMAEELENDG